MIEINVSSGILKEISYHGRIMYVKLKDGRMLSYNSVPEEVFNEFAKTSEHDEFYKSRIIPAFSFRRMA